MTIYVVYHADCVDGATAAWVFRNYIRKNKIVDLISYEDGIYEYPPSFTPTKDDTVYILDFSYKIEYMKDLVNKANYVVIIDHHKSAVERLKDLSGCTKIFDMNKSGALLTWEYLNKINYPKWVPNFIRKGLDFLNQLRIPLLVRYVSDYDLWTHKLPYVKEHNSYINSYFLTFDNLDKINRTPLFWRIIQGIPITRKHITDIRKYVSDNNRLMIIGGYEVRVCNLNRGMSSDGASFIHRFYKDFSDNLLFAATYYDSETERVFSLRTTVDFDVAKVAEQYGGGGHKYAAGFKVKFKDLEKLGLL